MAKSKRKVQIFATKYFGIIIGLIIFSLLLLINYGTILINNLEKILLNAHFLLKANITSQSLKEGVTEDLNNPLISNDIIIIGIDNNTLDRFGSWPFPRAVEANLVNTFTRIQDVKNRERAIFLDINFIERDLKNPENDTLMIDSIKENGRIFLESFFHPIELSKKMTEDHVQRQMALFKQCGLITSKQITGGDWKKLQEWKSVEAPLIPYGQIAYKYGNVSTLPDNDKIYRNQPIISRFSVLEKEIYLDDLTVNEKVDKGQLERLSWIDKTGRSHDIPELTEKVILNLRYQMQLLAPIKDIDSNNDGIIDDSQYIIRKYKDYLIPAITLSLALEYFNKDYSDIEIEIGKYVKIKEPKRYNRELDTWTPIIKQYAQYTFPRIFEAEDFSEKIIKKLESQDQATIKKGTAILLDCFEQNQIFNKFILKKNIDEKNLDDLHTILVNIGYSGIKKVKNAIYKNEILIPIDSRGKMLINYMGARSTIASGGNKTFTIRSFLGYTEDPGPDKKNWKRTKGVTDKLVIVGMFATGLADEKPTPFGLMFGPEVMANSLNTIIMGNFIIQAPFWLDILVFFIIILITCLISTRLKTIWGLLISLFMVIGYLVFVNLFFDHFNFLLSFWPSAFGIIFTFISIVVYRVMTEEKEKKKIKNMFGKYVSPTVVEDLLINPPELGGVDKELTVLFSDIRGFTTLSERMTPQALVNHLNEYLTAMTDLILEYKGTLDKYVGDEVMCFWGAPLPQEEHAILACKCALRQMEVLHALNKEWPPEKRINIGIGLNSGIMTVGNMGSPGRMNYTLMGDNVNLGARLEGTNKMYDTNIIISEFTYGLIKDQVVVRELDNIRVKGKNKPVLIYELIDII